MNSRFSSKFSARSAVVGGLMAASVLVVPVGSDVAQAADFTVMTNADSGVGSFREAVLKANASAGPDVITFVGVTGEIDLLSTVTITDSLTITGPGVDELTIGRSTDGMTITSADAGSLTVTDLGIGGRGDVAFGVSGGTDLTVERVKIELTGASAGLYVEDLLGPMDLSEVSVVGLDPVANGYAIQVESEPTTAMTLTDVTLGSVLGGFLATGSATAPITVERLESGTAEVGVYLLGEFDATISDSGFAGAGGIGVVAGNGGGGTSTIGITNSRIEGVEVGILTAGKVDTSVTDSSITDLVAGADDTIAIVADEAEGEITLDGVTISGFNGRPVATDTSDNTVTIRNSTISDLTTTETSLLLVVDTNLVIEHSTISGNTVNAGGGGVGVVVSTDNSSLVADHSIFTGNGPVGLIDFVSPPTAPPVVSWSVVPEGFAFDGTNQESDDPGLQALSDNGGPTHTMRPTATSPAIDNGDPAISDAPLLDQRDGQRIYGAAIDIGAVEYNGGTLSAASLGDGELDGTIEVIVSRTGGSDGAASVTAATADGTATAGEDYTALTVPLSWADGDMSDRTFDVEVSTDQLIEGDETFKVVLSDAVGATVEVASIDVLLIDDVDPLIDSGTPRRIVDTRATGDTVDDLNEGTGKLEAGEEIMVQVTGRRDGNRDIVRSDAIGVVMNVTAVQAEGTGFVTVHQCATPRPLTSSLNYTPSANLGNEIVAGLSSSGAVCIYTSQAAHITVDVVGDVPPLSPLQSVTPGRYFDTRAAGETIDDAEIGAGTTDVGEIVRLTVGGRGEVPDGAAAVIANVTAIGATDVGFVTVSACVSPTPNASSLNYVPGVNRGNELIVPLNGAGQLCLFTSSSIHLAVDIVAWIPVGSELTAVAPARLLDTRAIGTTIDENNQGDGKLEAMEEYQLPVVGRGGVADDADTVIINVTAVAPETTGFVTVHACLDERPLASSLNFGAGVNGGNELVASLSDEGELCLYTSTAAHLTVDVVAYLD